MLYTLKRHHNVQPKYIQFLFITYTLIKLEKNYREDELIIFEGKGLHILLKRLY